jgi:hypothetical protein
MCSLFVNVVHERRRLPDDPTLNTDYDSLDIKR